MPKRATSTSFTKENKPKGGRPKGALNKSTREVKEVLLAAFDANAGRINTELAKLEGKDYFDALSKILPYFVPKADTNVKVKGAVNLVVEFVDPDPDGE